MLQRLKLLCDESSQKTRPVIDAFDVPVQKWHGLGLMTKALRIFQSPSPVCEACTKGFAVLS